MAAPILTGEQSAIQNKRIRELAMKGMTIKEIEKKLGCRRKVIANRLTRMVASGQIPRASVRKHGGIYGPRRSRAWSVKFDIRLGTFAQLHKQLTDAELDWLYKATPKGCTLTDTLAGIVKDAFAEKSQL